MTEYASGFGAAARGVSPTISGGKWLLRRYRLLGTYEPEWLVLEGAEAGLSATQIANIHLFLASDEIRATLRLLTTVLLAPRSASHRETLDAIYGAFDTAAQRWCAEGGTGRTWKGQSQYVWSTILDIYEYHFSASEELDAAAAEFSDFIDTPLRRLSAGSRTNLETFVSRLGDLGSNIERVTQATREAELLRATISRRPIPPIITYTETDTSKPATFEDLYVPRTLVREHDDSTDESNTASRSIHFGANADSEEFVEANRDEADAQRNKGTYREILTSGEPFRVVVHGAPGAGKSTFVRNLRHQLAGMEDGQAALLATVREYNSTYKHLPLDDYLHHREVVAQGFEMDLQSFKDAATLGLFVVIFDGLDEITDIHQRVDMVERITSFANKYPTTSILVTSRTIGYDRAPLPSSTFEKLLLDQYTPNESELYVGKWFDFMGRPDLFEEFQRESDSVVDLKANPLLLSLLCVLYRERGSIPRRRRDIYQQCADLLFHKWDSHRHIDQPEELHANGDRIMQEIARWVYKFPSTHSGLAERQIEQCIGGYLKDTVGVEEGEARRRARDFLDFCATRAWMLARIGTVHGDRVFGFTHRTFYEYFAAEAFTRQSDSAEELCKSLLDAYKSDSTSVLPELLVQSYDEKRDRGAAELFKAVCEKGGSVDLILRLMEGVALPANARRVGFESIIHEWEDRGVKEEDFIALLSLNSDARGQFVRDFLLANTESDHPAGREIFLRCWAALELASRSARFVETWGASARHAAEQLLAQGYSSDQTAHQTWFWHTGLISSVTPNPNALFSTPSVCGDRVGYLWLTIEKMFEVGFEALDEGYRTVVSRTIDYIHTRSKTVHPGSAVALHRAVELRPTPDCGFDRVAQDKLTPDTEIAMYTACILEEGGGFPDEYLTAFDRFTSGDVYLALSARAAHSHRRTQWRDLDLKHQFAERSVSWPVWLRSWAKGRRHLVGLESEAH